MAIDRYLNLITSAHRNKPNFIAWLSSALNKVDDGITATNSIPSVFSISGVKLGTTNLVLNSGFEVVTTTATLFSDALTSYSGSTVPAPWTLQSGSFTFGASGATVGTAGIMTAGNAVWKSVVGSDGTTKLALKAQAIFTMPTSITSSQPIDLYLWQDANNWYKFHWDARTVGSGTVLIQKNSSGTVTNIGPTASVIPSASTAYTATLQIDDTGALTATITPSGGATTTLTDTDASPLTGGFLIGVGGDTGVVISNASVTAPWANSWTIGGDSRVAWGLTQSAIGGKYSPMCVSSISGVSGYIKNTTAIAISGSSSYTISGYVNVVNGGSKGVGGITASFNSGDSFGTSPLTGSVSTARYSKTGTTSGTDTTCTLYVGVSDSGTVTFDNIQLEQGSTATNYVENDSLSYPASTYSDQLDVIGQSIGADRDVGVQLSTGTSILDDAHYQTYLNAKISANQWDGTTPGLYKIWSSVFPGSSLKLTDNQDMTISLTISGITDSVVEEMINDGLIIPKPMGVKISSITFGTVLIYNKLDTQTWNTVQTYTWDQLEMQSF